MVQTTFTTSGRSDGRNEVRARREIWEKSSRGEVKLTGDDGDDEGVRDTGPLEEGSSVVEDEVDTGKLLHSLDPVGWRREGRGRSARAPGARRFRSSEK